MQSTDDLEDAIELAYEAGWTDGLPVVPPTEARVQRLLQSVNRAPSELIGEIPPKGGRATVEKIAVNAVMAGCLPGYLPVIISAVQALLNPRFNLASVQCSTHIATPLAVVNGPIAGELGIHPIRQARVCPSPLRADR